MMRGVWEIWPQFMAVLGILLIGVSKAGFGGGLAMLTTPLCVIAFGAKDAIGILLPLLCAGDAFSVRHYWGNWEARNLKLLLPGVVLGVLFGVQLIGKFSSSQLNLAIGLLAVAFVGFQVFKKWILAAEGRFKPGWKLALPFGLGTGIASTFAHGAGPVVAMFLIPQNMPKRLYVGTSALIFTWVNWIKMPFYCLDRESTGLALFAESSLITWSTLKVSLIYLPLIPIGVWLGIWLNRKFSEIWFARLVYALTFLAGLKLIASSVF